MKRNHVVGIPPGILLISYAFDKYFTKTLQAQSTAVAEIWLWQVGSWKAVGRLQFHSLTVTHMEFSHDDTLLLSVSRDRHFSVFSIERAGTNVFLFFINRISDDSYLYVISPFIL